MATLPRLANAFFPNWVDVQGGQANSMWTTADQSDAGLGPFSSLVSAAQSLSNAALFTGVIQTRSVIGGTPVVGPYGTVTDQVVFRMQSAGFGSNIIVPAPVDTIFLSDNTTVDLSNPLVTAFIAQVIAILGDSYGNPWISCSFGQRRKINLAGS
jgi:hypothetical protein